MFPYAFVLCQVPQDLQKEVQEMEFVRIEGRKGLQLHPRPPERYPAAKAECYRGDATDQNHEA